MSSSLRQTNVALAKWRKQETSPTKGVHENCNLVLSLRRELKNLLLLHISNRGNEINQNGEKAHNSIENENKEIQEKGRLTSG